MSGMLPVRMIVWVDEISFFRNESKLRGRNLDNIWFGNRPEFPPETPGFPKVSISSDTAVIEASCNRLFDEIQSYVGLRLVFNVSWDTCVVPSLSVAFTFLWTVVVCVIVTSPLLGQE